MADPAPRPLLPPAYLGIAIVAMLALHFAAPIVDVLSFPLTLAGLAPLAGGALLNLWADQVFKARGTTVKPFEKSTALVTSGAFALSRNPMYLGMTLILTGVALLLGTLTPFLVVAIFAVFLDRRFIRVEEQMLAESFGEAWRAYRGQVRRWL